ncbi:MAG: GTP-binding protein [Myxococcota bacterium]
MTTQPTAVNLIAGPLGVGKTTTINHLLKQRPEHETWAVLVNEYGLVGLDAALMSDEGSPGVHIREVAGGCICCTAAVMLEASLVQLLRRRPHRLLIEPTGLATTSGIVDTLNRPGIRGSVDLRSILCLLDPSRVEELAERDEVKDQIASATVLLASRADLATEDQLRAFDTWASSLRPRKQWVGSIRKGVLDPALLDLVGEPAAPAPPHEHLGHAHDAPHDEMEKCDASNPIVQRTHRSPAASTMGWICWDALVFDADRVSHLLRRLAEQPGTRRLKAVLRTNQGWWGFNFADQVQLMSQREPREDSRLELVFEGADPPDADAVQQEIRGCLVSQPAA